MKRSSVFVLCFIGIFTLVVGIFQGESSRCAFSNCQLLVSQVAKVYIFYNEQTCIKNATVHEPRQDNTSQPQAFNKGAFVRIFLRVQDKTTHGFSHPVVLQKSNTDQQLQLTCLNRSGAGVQSSCNHPPTTKCTHAWRRLLVHRAAACLLPW